MPQTSIDREIRRPSVGVSDLLWGRGLSLPYPSPLRGPIQHVAKSADPRSECYTQCGGEVYLSPTPLRLGVRSDMSQNARENSSDLAKSTFYSNSIRCAPARRPSSFLSVLCSEKVIARALLIAARSVVGRPWTHCAYRRAQSEAGGLTPKTMIPFRMQNNVPNLLFYP